MQDNRLGSNNASRDIADRETPPISVLHIGSDFAQQHVYTQLVSHLDQAGLKQQIYSAVRTAWESEWRLPPELRHIPCRVRFVLRKRHRVLYRAKIRRVHRDILRHTNLRDVKIIHAHFLYSDGAVALRLKRKFNVPYLVAIRNTDLNFFMRYRRDLQFIRNDILRHACRIVLLTPSYRPIVLDQLPRSLRAEIDDKFVVIPSGIEKHWLSSAGERITEHDDTLRLLYVGDFSRNKNLPGTLEAVAALARRHKVHFSLVGGGGEGDGAAEMNRLLESGRYPFVDFVGRVNDIQKLREIYRNHDIFVMASFKETFGLVYLEALSQGLPILHSRGQGVDGYFDGDDVAEAADATNPAEIAQKIHVLADRLPEVRNRCVRAAQRFNWPQIAATYARIYDKFQAD